MMRVVRGEEVALGELMDRYWTPLVKYTLGFLGDIDSSEDVVQEVFVRAWRNRASWTPTGNVGAYLYRIGRNLALQEADKRRVRRRFAQSGVAPEGPPTPAEDLERKRTRLALEAALAALPARRQEALVLARFHGLSYEQIAEVMGISVQTVANQISSALRDLRAALGK